MALPDYDIPFTTYVSSPTGGPTKFSQALIASRDDYRAWRGDDIGPGFQGMHDHMDQVDFSRQMLVALGTGTVQSGTTVNIDGIHISGGDCLIRYTVAPPQVAPIPPNATAEPYILVQTNIFSGYNVQWVRSPGPITSYVVGEEGPIQSTAFVGEEAPPSTQIAGEEGPFPTTQYTGEEAPPSTQVFGEEGPHPTTAYVGEEAPPSTLMLGEEGPHPTTQYTGEEAPPSTLALGEEGPHPTTEIAGEEGPRPTTEIVGEEGPPTTQAIGEEHGPTTMMMGEEHNNPFGKF